MREGFATTPDHTSRRVADRKVSDMPLGLVFDAQAFFACHPSVQAKTLRQVLGLAQEGAVGLQRLQVVNSWPGGVRPAYGQAMGQNFMEMILLHEGKVVSYTTWCKPYEVYGSHQCGYCGSDAGFTGYDCNACRAS